MEHELNIIGRVETVRLPEVSARPLPARIDTGAKTSAIWASRIIEKDGVLTYCLFGKSSEFYTGEKLQTTSYQKILVATSTGHIEERYAVRMLVRLKKRNIRATVTLANRSMQVYPMLVGRNVLRGKFIVNVKLGKALLRQENLREEQKKTLYEKNRKGKDVR